MEGKKDEWMAAFFRDHRAMDRGDGSRRLRSESMLFGLTLGFGMLVCLLVCPSASMGLAIVYVCRNVETYYPRSQIPGLGSQVAASGFLEGLREGLRCLLCALLCGLLRDLISSV